MSEQGTTKPSVYVVFTDDPGRKYPVVDELATFAFTTDEDLETTRQAAESALKAQLAVNIRVRDNYDCCYDRRVVTATGWLLGPAEAA